MGRAGGELQRHLPQTGDQRRGRDHDEDCRGAHQGSGGRQWEQRLGERLTLSNNLDISFQWFNWQIVQNTSPQ